MAKIEKKSIHDTYSKPRGWGCEYWIENLPQYCGKILVIDKGKRGSLHFHMNKMETMYLQSGHVTLRLIDSDDGTEYFVDLWPGDSILIKPGQVHQIISPDDRSYLIEFSTTHNESDSHRVQKGDC